jgi:hypothetical protein
MPIMGLAYCPRATCPPPPAKARRGENKKTRTNNVAIENINNFLPLSMAPSKNKGIQSHNHYSFSILKNGILKIIFLFINLHVEKKEILNEFDARIEKLSY